jgi:hypothetical protein
MDKTDFFWLMYLIVLIGLILLYANSGEGEE